MLNVLLAKWSPSWPGVVDVCWAICRAPKPISWVEGAAAAGVGSLDVEETEDPRASTRLPRLEQEYQPSVFNSSCAEWKSARYASNNAVLCGAQGQTSKGAGGICVSSHPLRTQLDPQICLYGQRLCVDMSCAAWACRRRQSFNSSITFERHCCDYLPKPWPNVSKVITDRDAFCG